MKVKQLKLLYAIGYHHRQVSSQQAYIKIIMRTEIDTKIYRLLFLFILVVVTAATALVLALLLGPLRHNPSSFNLPPNPGTYLQAKYQSTDNRLFGICLSGLSLSLLLGALGTIATFLESRRSLWESEASQQIECLWIKAYMCASFGVMSSVVGLGIQACVLVETESQRNSGEWLSIAFSGANLVAFILIVFAILFSRTELTQPSGIDSIPHMRRPLFYTNNTQIHFEISSNPRRDQEHSQNMSPHKPTMHIRSTKPRKSKKNKLTQPTPQETPATPCVQPVENAPKLQIVESDSSDAPDFPLNVENATNKSQKWKDKVPKLQIELINPRINRRVKELQPMNDLEISEIRPLREVKTTAEKDYAIKISPCEDRRPSQLAHSKSVLSHLNEGKIPQQVSNKKKSGVLRYGNQFQQLNHKHETQAQEKQSKPRWLKHSVSFDSD